MPSTEPFSSVPGRARSGLDLVVIRAATDPEFRARLLADPKQAIETTFDIVLPAALRLRFCEKDPDIDIQIVLPDLVPSPERLTEDQLDSAVGGHGGHGDDHWLATRHPLARSLPPAGVEP